MTQQSSTPKLSKRDKLLLAMSALDEVDTRQPGTRNSINFSGSIFASNNMNYVLDYCEQMSDWSESQLIEFAFLHVESLKGEKR